MTQSKEEKISALKQRITLFIDGLKNPYSFDNILLGSSAPKKDRIRMWGETLEKIFYLEGRHDEIDSISTIITLELRALGLNKAITYVRMVLPFKYKDASQQRDSQLLADTFNHSDNNYRELTEADYTKENQIEINESLKDIKTTEKWISRLKHNHLLSKINLTEYDDYRTRRSHLRVLIDEADDFRDKVLPSKLHLYMMAFAIATKSYTFAKYMEHIRTIISITTKQTSKLLGGRVNKIDILYEPLSLLVAKQAGFYGVPCGECGSYRVDTKYNPDEAKNMLFCYRCRTWNERTSEKLVAKLI